jgi:hypothetical protein
MGFSLFLVAFNFWLKTIANRFAIAGNPDHKISRQVGINLT